MESKGNPIEKAIYKVEKNLNIDSIDDESSYRKYGILQFILLSDSLKKPFENVVELKPSSI